KNLPGTSAFEYAMPSTTATWERSGLPLKDLENVDPVTPGVRNTKDSTWRRSPDNSNGRSITTCASTFVLTSDVVVWSRGVTVSLTSTVCFISPICRPMFSVYTVPVEIWTSSVTDVFNPDAFSST